ncbi:glutamate receptor [Plakobranchus ocellatus]|uniref:Glutamate receptor n=1 Tax=Plakobranchus ocellatus TaxID=259542 RepID=A0AAV3YJ00_9GAST|nr:glutamate receptor [Plakobranchus ocellatus]
MAAGVDVQQVFNSIVIHVLLCAGFLKTISSLDDISIGGIFDTGSVQALTAFQHEIHVFNRRQAHSHPYQIAKRNSVLEVTDSFAVSNARE